jgi:hypothetical protein
MSVKVLSDQDYGSVSRILNLQAPLSINEPARLADLNSAVEGLSHKDNVRVSTQANINLASPGATIDGITMAPADRVLVRNQTAQAENGIYVWAAAASVMQRSPDANTAIELENAIVLVDEGTDAGNTFRQTAVNFTLGTNPVIWVIFGGSVPAASTTTAGIIEIATQGEVDAGSATNLAVVPSTLAGWSGRKLKFAADIGDGSATQYDVSHNLNTRDVAVSVYRNATPWDTVICDTERLDVNTARLRFAVAPSANAYRVVVLG